MRSFVLSIAFFSLFPSLFQAGEPAAYSVITDKNDLSILTPSFAKRQTLKLRLSNQLEVYLVSDKEAEESAAALAVEVGSWNDPKEFPGMAHFLEHMLFMGTKAYPDEKAFSQFISDHGGSTNAYTSLDRTVYMFSCNHDGFNGGLDLFSHFFIDPLFKESEVGRELHAVDQEHMKNIESDSRRQWMIFKETGNQHHPNRAFATGNAQTLGHIPREALLTFYDTHYSSNLMHLVIYSALPLETLQNMVVEKFSKVENRGFSSLIPYDKLSSEAQMGHMLYVKPIKDVKILSLDWEMPQEISEDNTSFSLECIAQALAAGGKNSLLEQLKKEGLAESMQVHPSDFSSHHRFFSINVMLTKEGVVKVNTVIERIFQTLHLLQERSIPSYVYKELETMSLIHYTYQSRDKAFDFVTTAAAAMLDEPLATFPKTTHIPSCYQPKKIQSLVQSLTPSTCLYSLMASTDLTGVMPDKKEMWNGGEYCLKPIADSLLTKWSKESPHPAIALIEPNPYIPQDLSLLNSSSQKPENKHPRLLSSSEYGKHYIWEDTLYKTPEVTYLIGIKSPLLTSQIEKIVSADLLIKTFYQKASPLLHLAGVGGLSCSVDQKNLRLNFQIQGYSEKAPEFLKDIFLTLKTLSCNKKEFQIYKDSLLSYYENQNKAQPYQQAGEVLSNILYNDTPLSSEKAAALKKITYEDFSHYLAKFFSQCYLQGLYCGNLDSTSQEKLQGLVTSCLHGKPYPVHNHPHKEILLLSRNIGPCKVREKIPVLGNSTVLAIQQGAFTFEKKAAQLVLNSVLSESFFNTLRSQQQTGYITASWPREVERQLMQFFLVQSSTHQPEDLLGRYELFLEGYVKDFGEKLSKERFEEIRKNCIETVAQLPPNLTEMATNLFELAFERHGDFDYQLSLITALEKLSYEDVKKECISCLSRKNANRLAVLVEGELPEQFIYKKTTPQALKKLGMYVSHEN
jgi:insulysin